jgi:hypothetical protein
MICTKPSVHPAVTARSTSPMGRYAAWPRLSAGLGCGEPGLRGNGHVPVRHDMAALIEADSRGLQAQVADNGGLPPGGPGAVLLTRISHAASRAGQLHGQERV